MSAVTQKKVDMFNWGDIPDWTYATVGAILESVKLADPRTYQHCLRVGVYAKALARAAGLNEYQQLLAEFAGALHDVGKIGIEKEVLHKPGKLSPEEYELVKHHPEFSEEIIKSFKGDALFDQITPAVRAHHERVDGLGYPDKLHGEDIPLLARVILIVDTLDAMGENRSYRKGLPVEVIYQELKKYAGTQFDFSLVRTFLDSHRFWQNLGIENSMWVSSESNTLIIPSKKAG